MKDIFYAHVIWVPLGTTYFTSWRWRCTFYRWHGRRDDVTNFRTDGPRGGVAICRSTQSFPIYEGVPFSDGHQIEDHRDITGYFEKLLLYFDCLIIFKQSYKILTFNRIISVHLRRSSRLPNKLPIKHL